MSYPDNWDEIRRLVYNRDGYTCQNCGRGDVELHCHHIVPKSRGGTHRLSNLVTLCKDCHDAVHNKHVVAPTAGEQQQSLISQLMRAWRLFRRLT